MTDQTARDGSSLASRIAETLRQHRPTDTSGGADDKPLIFCGGHQWHEEFDGWDDWSEHVSAAVLALFEPEWGTGDAGGKPIQTGWDEAGAQAWEARRKKSAWVRRVGPWEPAAASKRFSAPPGGTDTTEGLNAAPVGFGTAAEGKQ